MMEGQTALVSKDGYHHRVCAVSSYNDQNPQAKSYSNSFTMLRKNVL